MHLRAETRLGTPVHQASRTLHPTPARAARPPRDPAALRVRTDGKFFAVGEERFRFHGVTYGTFHSRADGALFPDKAQIAADFRAIADAGFTVVRTYTPPPDDVLELAAANGLRVFVGVFYPDWRYMLGDVRSERRRIAREARAEVMREAQRLAGNPAVLGVSVGNEVPADVVRWLGTDAVSGLIADLAECVHEADAEMPVTYANYPTAEYLPLPSLDFVTFNVFLENRPDFRSYLTRLHHLASDRPLVLGEVGLDAGAGEDHQAETLDWQLSTAVERGVAGTCIFSWTDDWAVADKTVEGWSFGLTTADRVPRPALEVATRWSSRGLADLDFEWPTISVVICARNAGATLDECLAHTTRLDYPGLEVIVVDDGSADNTGQIARSYEGVRLVSIPHSGLSAARNAGFRAAENDLIAYLDADAYPINEWPYLLALGMDRDDVGGCGGPNIPPREDPVGAQAVAHAAGGPTHVLISDDRAEHIPGCNMAFWRQVLEEVDGFDPVYDAAGDDVDFCWRVIQRGWQIGYHPAAMVWHHRRAGFGAYARQQRGYGRAEALVQARHPDRFTSAGTARWRGSIYNAFVPTILNPRIYRGEFGAAAYQSVYRADSFGLDLAYQVGMPFAALALLTAPFALLTLTFGLPALAAFTFIVALGLLDARRVAPPRSPGSGLPFRLRVVGLNLTQPLMRAWGRARGSFRTRRNGPRARALPGPAQPMPGRVLLLPLDRPRAELAAGVVKCLREDGYRVSIGTGWEDFDAGVIGSTLLMGELVTAAHPEGSCQLRLRKRLRPRWLALTLALTLIGLAVHPLAAAGVAVVAAVEVLRAMWRLGPRARRVISNGCERRRTPRTAPSTL
jgi:glycosyltransferase involved in cell wall biosynthesis